MLILTTDEEMLADLLRIGQNLTQELQQEAGRTHVFLNGSSMECRLRECNLGNVVTDAMVHVVS